MADCPEVGSLAEGFYDRPVVEVAGDLIGCMVSHRCSDRSETRGGSSIVGGVIVETEAYHESEPACHAFVGLTPRTETLFGPAGRAYVYRSYGIHALLNAVCEHEGVGAAVLIRALEPVVGLDEMRARRGRVGGRPAADTDLCSGPGKLTQALGIELSDNNGDLRTGPVVIGARAQGWDEPVIASLRVGITKAAELPWRFSVAGNRHVSSPRPRMASGVSPWRLERESSK